MSDEKKTSDRLTLINELARRRGFFWQSYEIYGGASGFATYGALGTRLKQNIERKVRELFVYKLGMLEIESPVITPGKVFEASGHIENFKEPLIECLDCKRRFRVDHLIAECTEINQAGAEKLDLTELGDVVRKKRLLCPECGGKFGDPKHFLTMFKTTIGPYSDAVGYGRPEAAQGIFVEFKRLYEAAREKLPFGAMQLGRALRNEISPRQGLLRLREFTIGDLEFFFDPEESDCHLLRSVEKEILRLCMAETRLKGSENLTEVTVKEALSKGYIQTAWQAVFMAHAKRLLNSLGVPSEKQRFIEKHPWERAHYSLQTFDQEVVVERWGWVEVTACAYRADYDLKRHTEFSGQDMHVFKEYEKPIEKEQTMLKPVMAKLGPVFKNEAGKVAQLLSKADPERVGSSLKNEGRFVIEEFEILPEHVEIKREKVLERGRRFIPHVVEPTFGIDRLFYVAFEYAYHAKEDRTLLSFPIDIAPTQAGVYPLVSKDGLPEAALKLHKELLDEGFVADYDEAGSIGRRYARADEVGVPLGITVDYETLQDDTATVRDRDSWKQIRAKTRDLPDLLRKYFLRKISFEDLGALVKT